MHRTLYFLVLFFVPAFATPPPEKKPPPFKHGEIVGVRPGEYETKPKVGYSPSPASKISIILICNAGGLEGR